MITEETAADAFDAIVRDIQARCMACNHAVAMHINDMHEAMHTSFRRLRSIARSFPRAMSEQRSVSLSEVSNIIKSFMDHPGKWNSGLFGVPPTLR